MPLKSLWNRSSLRPIRLVQRFGQPTSGEMLSPFLGEDHYLVTSDTTLTVEQITTLYQKRWKVEEYHKSLKIKRHSRVLTSNSNNARGNMDLRNMSYLLNLPAPAWVRVLNSYQFSIHAY